MGARSHAGLTRFGRQGAGTTSMPHFPIPRFSFLAAALMTRRLTYQNELLVLLFDRLEKSLEIRHFRFPLDGVGLQIGQLGRQRLVQTPLSLQIFPVALHLLCREHKEKAKPSFTDGRNIPTRPNDQNPLIVSFTNTFHGET